MTVQDGQKFTTDRDGYFAVPVHYANYEAIKAWCHDNCAGDWLGCLGRRVLFELQEDAVLASLWWRAEEE